MSHQRRKSIEREANDRQQAEQPAALIALAKLLARAAAQKRSVEELQVSKPARTSESGS